MFTTYENFKNGTIRGTSIAKASTMSPITKLIGAVVMQAANDIKENNPHADSAKEFFNSQWFNDLTNLDGKLVLEKLQEECA